MDKNDMLKYIEVYEAILTIEEVMGDNENTLFEKVRLLETIIGEFEK